MIKEALQYIVDLRKPEIQEINGEMYSDKELKRIRHNPLADPIRMSTLSSLIDYIRSGVDMMRGRMIVHVVSPTNVKLYSQLDDEREREFVAEVTANVPEFRFNSWMEHEYFCIGMQSKFVPNEDRDLIMKFAGTVESGTISEYGDDGVSQKATIKTGIAKKGDALVPNPVHLRAYRTFIEVEQPEALYVFRMQDKSGVQCALYEADGGAWKNEAMLNVKRYLEFALNDMEDYIVIA